MLFPEFSENSKVWVYKSNRALNADDIQLISDTLNEFVPKWAAHGTQLYGSWTILEDWFVVLTVDEEKFSASGCSIDSSVKVIKSLGSELGIDFFNRMNVLIEENNALKEIHFAEIDKHPEALLFNPIVTDLKSLRESWKIPAKDFSLV